MPFAGVEERLAAAVLMAGFGDVSRGGWSLRPDARYAETMRPLDGVAFIRDARAALFFQFARRDAFVRAPAAGRLTGAAPDARVEWYDADHSLSPGALEDRAAWLCERLSLAPPGPTWLDGVRLPRRDLWKHRLAAPIYRLLARSA